MFCLLSALYAQQQCCHHYSILVCCRFQDIFLLLPFVICCFCSFLLVLMSLCLCCLQLLFAAECLLLLNNFTSFDTIAPNTAIAATGGGRYCHLSASMCFFCVLVIPAD